MKKIIAIVAVSVLSLLNGMAAKNEDRQIHALAKDLMPLAIVLELSELFADDSNVSLIKQIAKEKHIHINLHEAKKDCSRLAKQIEKLDGRLNKEELNSKKFTRAFIKEQQKMCLRKHNLNIDLGALVKGKGSPSNAMDTIECLLRSYDHRLVRKAEALINDIKNNR